MAIYCGTWTEKKEKKENEKEIGVKSENELVDITAKNQNHFFPQDDNILVD